MTDLSLENSFKYTTSDDALGGCIQSEGNVMLTPDNVTSGEFYRLAQRVAALERAR